MLRVGEFLCLLIVAVYAHPQDKYVRFPRAMTLDALRAYVVGIWYNETMRVLFNRSVPSTEIGKAVRIQETDDKFLFYSTAFVGHTNLNGSITCYQKNHDAPARHFFKFLRPDRFYLNYFSTHPMSYFIVLRCYIPEGTKKCQSQYAQLKVHSSTIPDSATLAKIWTDLNEIDVYEDDAGVNVYFFDLGVLDAMYEACKIPA